MANRVLFVSVSKLIKDTPLNGSLDNDLGASMIATAQDKYIWTKLGTDLYDKLRSDITGATLTGNYETLVNTYISPALTWWALYEMLPSLRVRLVSHSIVIMNSEQSTAATSSDVQPIMDRAKDNAEFYTQRLIDYLCDNTDLFPEYSTNTGSDLDPSSANYNGGLNLDYVSTYGRKYPRKWYE